MNFRRACVATALLLSGTIPALPADTTAPFDLAGPKIDVRVTRGGKTLPIAEVPNLEPGDKVWVHPNLPPTQSARYLMVIAFLRGATNPPPEKWFLKAETWSKQVSEEGLVFTVPEDAQQTLLFLAPETGGDYKTLRNAVRGRPGAFVRSSQDLNQASLDRSRVQTYVAAIRKASDADPKTLHDISLLLARSLNLKVNQDCFDKPTNEQEQCLTQNSDQLVLNDGHSQSMVSTLTNGPGSDLVSQLSATPTAGAGYYSAYVGAVVDMARLLESLHTAEYQYIPALNFPKQDTLDLKLNNPPSFHNPKSVIVVALPAIEPPQFPPLHAIDPKQIRCLAGADLVLPTDGSPLVYSTAYAHNLVLHVQDKTGKSVDLPTTAVASKGGFVVDAASPQGTKLGANTSTSGLSGTHVSGTVKGLWGFQPFTGPSFPLQLPHSVTWTVAPADTTSLVVGREDELHLQGEAACVTGVSFRDAAGKEMQAEYKVTKPDELSLKIPLADAAPGSLTLLVQQGGLAKPDEMPLHTYAEAGHLDAFSFHSGDSTGVLKGTRLDEVSNLVVEGVHFVPGELSRKGDKDLLQMKAVDAAAAKALAPKQQLTAKVALKDGRVLSIPTSSEAARPQVTLMSKSVEPAPDQAAANASPTNVTLTDPNELPMGERVSFFLKTVVPASFSRTERIEIASTDESLHTTLDMSDGSLILQDATILRGVFDPLKSFGPSAFGPLQLRPVDANGVKGDWTPLGTLVRVPSITALRCPRASKNATPAGTTPAQANAQANGEDQPAAIGAQSAPGGASTGSAVGSAAQADTAGECTLTGTNLFLIDSVASDAQFSHSISVPDGFASTTLNVPRPAGGQLYLKLRDDPSVANTITTSATLPMTSRNGAGPDGPARKGLERARTR